MITLISLFILACVSVIFVSVFGIYALITMNKYKRKVDKFVKNARQGNFKIKYKIYW